MESLSHMQAGMIYFPATTHYHFPRIIFFLEKKKKEVVFILCVCQYRQISVFSFLLSGSLLSLPAPY